MLARRKILWLGTFVTGLVACGGAGSQPATYSEAVTSGATWKIAATGTYHTVAVKTDGTLWAWGNNGFGQLGDGTTTDHYAPVQIGSGFASVAAGEYHTVAVKTDGTLWAWGWNTRGELGDVTLGIQLTPT